MQPPVCPGENGIEPSMGWSPSVPFSRSEEFERWIFGAPHGLVDLPIRCAPEKPRSADRRREHPRRPRIVGSWQGRSVWTSRSGDPRAAAGSGRTPPEPCWPTHRDRSGSASGPPRRPQRDDHRRQRPAERRGLVVLEFRQGMAGFIRLPDPGARTEACRLAARNQSA
jgi:hypothetical protein